MPDDNKPIQWWEWLTNTCTIIIAMACCWHGAPYAVTGGFFLLLVGFGFGMRVRGRLDYLIRTDKEDS
jgi:hypothetical protein